MKISSRTSFAVCGSFPSHPSSCVNFGSAPSTNGYGAGSLFTTYLSLSLNGGGRTGTIPRTPGETLRRTGILFPDKYYCRRPWKTCDPVYDGEVGDGKCHHQPPVEEVPTPDEIPLLIRYFWKITVLIRINPCNLAGFQGHEKTGYR